MMLALMGESAMEAREGSHGRARVEAAPQIRPRFDAAGLFGSKDQPLDVDPADYSHQPVLFAHISALDESDRRLDTRR